MTPSQASQNDSKIIALQSEKITPVIAEAPCGVKTEATLAWLENQKASNVFDALQAFWNGNRSFSSIEMKDGLRAAGFIECISHKTFSDRYEEITRYSNKAEEIETTREDLNTTGAVLNNLNSLLGRRLKRLLLYCSNKLSATRKELVETQTKYQCLQEKLRTERHAQEMSKRLGEQLNLYSPTGTDFVKITFRGHDLRSAMSHKDLANKSFSEVVKEYRLEILDDKERVQKYEEQRRKKENKVTEHPQKSLRESGIPFDFRAAALGSIGGLNQGIMAGLLMGAIESENRAS